MKRLIQLLMFVALIVSIAVTSVSAEGSMAVQYHFGIDNKVAPNETIPVYVDITNNGEPFKGEFAYENVEFYNGGHEVVIPFEVDHQETVRLKFYINGMYDNYIDSALLRNRTHIYEDSIESGKKVSLDFPTLKAPSMLAYEAQRVLLVSDSERAFEVIKLYKREHLSKDIEIAQVTKSDQSYLSGDRKDLDMYKMIYVDESGVDLLTEPQQQALLEWTRQGGILFLAGNVELEGYPEVLSFNGNEVEVLNSSSKPSTLTDGSVIARLNYSSGQVIHASSSFDEEIFANSPQVETLLSSMLEKNYSPKYMINTPYKASDFADQNSYFDTFYYNTAWILLFLVVYVLLVGPLLYLWLKKKDKREKMWLFMPIVAIIASTLLFIFGASDRIMKPKTQTMELVTLNGAGDAQVETAYSFVTNKRGDYQVTAPLNTNMTSFNGYGSITNPSIHEKVLLRTNEEQQTMSLRKLPYWSVQTIIGSEFQTEVGQLKNALQIENGQLTGTIQNELETDVENVLLISGKNIVELGSIKANETITIDQKLGFTTISKPLYQEHYMDEAAFYSLNNKEKMHKQKMDRLINAAMNVSGEDWPILVAFSDKAYTSMALEGDHSKEALTLFVQKPSIQMIFNGEFTIESNEFSVGFNTQNPNQYADIYAEEEDVYGSIHEGEHILQYTLTEGFVPETTKWKELQLRYNQQELVVEIFNFTTKQYEKLDIGTWKNQSPATDYINNRNMIELKVSTFTEFYGGMIKMPTFTLKGEAYND